MKKEIRKGWTTPGKGERSVRERAYGLWGQEVWYKLIEMGFVEVDSNRDPVGKFNERLQNFLIWGYFETFEESPAGKSIANFDKRIRESMKKEDTK